MNRVNMSSNNANIIDGKAFSNHLIETLIPDIKTISNIIGRPPTLAVILVGEDSASQVYVRNKIRQTEAAGMISIEHRLSADTDEKTLLAQVRALNDDDNIDGILVQLPLPKHINEHSVIQAINPEKDVDGFHVVNAGKLATGLAGLVPCTPLGCVLLLRETLGDLSGLNAVIIGRSNIVGKPLGQLLLAENASVTIVHSRTKNIEDLTSQADILIAAIGRPEMVKSSWIKKGACVIDVGINRIPASEKGVGKFRLVGDVDFAQACLVADSITPVPGGVGPMTISCLLRNTVLAAAQRKGVEIGFK
ncbi:bifunctional methylenetetrahydrofolate dehydrogenase/methenyltetrahydrofolate cyclohydrolase FolD [Alphaproteobacteria bacterium]|nr:bifunctional methylenetetrahydrofolate dehydrogenase/methenyltetrahydrofolate cyclohydrolase FolD [Alphaproteobacteria bacterium]